jgi:transcriptional regulator with XRE-family HTH domain
MSPFVAYNATAVKGGLDSHLNDETNGPGVVLHCVKHSAGNFTLADDQTTVTRIHQNKTPRRIHFIAEWLDKRGLKQAHAVRALGVDKGTMSRWCRGDMPENKNLGPLIDFLQLEDPIDLFRHPNEVWIRKLLEGRSAEEIEHIKESMTVTWRKRNGTDG